MILEMRLKAHQDTVESALFWLETFFISMLNYFCIVLGVINKIVTVTFDDPRMVREVVRQSPICVDPAKNIDLLRM